MSVLVEKTIQSVEVGPSSLLEQKNAALLSLVLVSPSRWSHKFQIQTFLAKHTATLATTRQNYYSLHTTPTL